MGDRDVRGGRDARADRYGGDAQHNSSSDSRVGGQDGGSGSAASGGRYSRALHRRDHEDRNGNFGSSTNNSGYSGDGGAESGDFRQHQRPRYDNGHGNAWPQQPQQQQPFPGAYGGDNAYGAQYQQNPMHYNANFPFNDMMAQQQQQQYNNMSHGAHMPFDMPNFANDMNMNNSGMNQTDLLQFLLQQQQQPPQQQHQQWSGPSGHHSPMPDGPYSNNSYNGEDGNAVRVPNSAPAASRVLPSVDEFVPVVPKSLLSLVRGGPSSNTAGEGDGEATGGSNTGSPLPAGVGAAGGALVLLEAPKIAPEMDRRAREQRRAHLSGFPNSTTREELEDYFRLLLPEVRRLKTEREIRELAEETGLIKDEGEDAVRTIPVNANLANIDAVKDLTLNQGKVKAFSFIELRLADMIDELVQQCQTDPQRFLFTSAADGRAYPLTIRRPRDTEPLTGVEMNKVVLIGFPLSMPAEAVKPVFESFDTLTTFEMKNGYAYGEFAELRDATDFRADVHGRVLGNSMVIALPLYDWLKALLVREGLDIPIAEDDPVSGSYVMKQVRERIPDAAAGANSAHGGNAAGGDGSGDGSGKSTALVLAEDPEAASLQIMRELLDMSFTLPDMLARFAGLYPHLRPLYANTQVTVFPTPVLVLLNLFDEDELVYDATYSQLLADIEEEVEKYGRVRRLVVPRREARPKLPEAPKPGVDFNDDDAEAKDAAMAAYAEAKRNFGSVLGRYMNRQTHPVWGGYGRVFVEYETVDEAAEAQQQIAGKLFGDRTVVTSFLFPDLMKEEGEEEEEEEGEQMEAAASEKEADVEAGGEDHHEGSSNSEAQNAEDSADNHKAADEEVEEGDAGDDDVAESATSEHAEDID